MRLEVRSGVQVRGERPLLGRGNAPVDTGDGGSQVEQGRGRRIVGGRCVRGSVLEPEQHERRAGRGRIATEPHVGLDARPERPEQPGERDAVRLRRLSGRAEESHERSGVDQRPLPEIDRREQRANVVEHGRSPRRQQLPGEQGDGADAARGVRMPAEVPAVRVELVGARLGEPAQRVDALHRLGDRREVARVAHRSLDAGVDRIVLDGEARPDALQRHPRSVPLAVAQREELGELLGAAQRRRPEPDQRAAAQPRDRPLDRHRLPARGEGAEPEQELERRVRAVAHRRRLQRRGARFEQRGPQHVEQRPEVPAGQVVAAVLPEQPLQLGDDRLAVA